MIAAFLAASVIDSSAPWYLERGGPGGESLRYWAVQDTFLDSSKPTDNFGRDPLLSAGPNKTVLIHFGDLRRMAGPGNRIKSAKLILNQEIGETPQLKSVSTVRVPWGEGGGRRGMSLIPVTLAEGAKTPTGAATWNTRFGGRTAINWQSPGASGAADVAEISGVKGETIGEKYVISGLAEAMNAELDAPADNHGLALRFNNVCDFSSSENPFVRPRLELEFEPAVRVMMTMPDIMIESVNRTPEDPKPGQEVGWLITLRNVGEADAGLTRVTVSIGGEEMSVDAPSIKAGSAAVARLPMKHGGVVSDPRSRTVLVRADVSGPELDRSNNAISFAENAAVASFWLDPKVDARRPQIMARLSEAWRFANDVALPQSKFSFALDGAQNNFRIRVGTEQSTPIGEREANEILGDDGLRAAVQLIAKSAGLDDLRRSQIQNDPESGRRSIDWFAGIMGGGDTRNDTDYPQILNLIPEPWSDPAINALGLQSTDLFSATDVATLHAIGQLGPNFKFDDVVPKRTSLRILDAGGRLVKDATVEFYRPAIGGFEAQPSVSLKSTGTGVINVTDDFLKVMFGTIGRDLGLATVRLKVKTATTEAWGYLKGWQWVDAYARGNRDSAIISARLNLVDHSDDTTTNLAAGKLVTDSAGRAPTELLGLVDNKPDSAVTFGPDGGWFEIDLNKDRVISGVRLEARTLWSNFKIMTYTTGQRADSAMLWHDQVDTAWYLKAFGLTFRGPSRPARYIRVVFPKGQSAEISGLDVFAAKL